MKLIAFFLILAIVGPTKSTTRFQVSGKLQCDFPIVWCVYVRLVERNFFVDDTIDSFGVKCFQGPGTEDYELDGKQYGDHFDSNYLIQLVFGHNCSNHDIKRTFMSLPRTVSTSETNYSFTANYTLSVKTGLGTPVKDFFN